MRIELTTKGITSTLRIDGVDVTTKVARGGVSVHYEDDQPVVTVEFAPDEFAFVGEDAELEVVEPASVKEVPDLLAALRDSLRRDNKSLDVEASDR